MADPKQARASGGSGRGQGAAVKRASGGTSKNGGTTKNAGTTKNGSSGRGASGRPARTGGADARRAAATPAPARTSKPGQTRKARDRARARELAEQRANAAPVQVGPPLWVQLTSFVLAIAGLGVSVYMTIEHFTGNTTLACSTSGGDNCLKVTTSPESMVFGVIPVAVLGLAFYAFMVAVTTPWAWRSPRREIAMARLGSVIVGVGFILYLIYVELFQVSAICLWCTSVHVITFLLFVVITLAAAVWGLVPRRAGQADSLSAAAAG
jgi:uncharacterized membrane protein